MRNSITKGEVVNKPKINRWIGGMYLGLTILVSVLYLGITFCSGILLEPLISQIVFGGLMVFVVVLMATITYSLYRTKYVIHEGVLSSWSPFAIIRLRLKDIKEVELARIPFHIRIYGAGLYCGLFYIPGLGRTKTIMTNLSDGVLITTKDRKHGKKYYLITPSDPERFVKLLKGK